MDRAIKTPRDLLAAVGVRDRLRWLFRWARWLKLVAQTRANGGVCSIDIRIDELGFFGHLYMLLVILQYCERRRFIAYVRSSSALYLDPSRGPDWLDYYFKMQRALSPTELSRIRYTTQLYDGISKQIGVDIRTDTSIKDVALIFSRHFEVRDHITETLDGYWQNIGTRGPVLGIHYRGTDKVSEAPRVSWNHCLSVLESYLDQHPDTGAVFVASDEQSFIDFLKSSVKGVPVYSHDDHYRSRDNRAVHTSEGGGYEKGEDALLNALLLSKCTTLIRTTSWLSVWASFFNPSLNIILLNKPYDYRPWNPEMEILKQPSNRYCPEPLP